MALRIILFVLTVFFLNNTLLEAQRIGNSNYHADAISEEPLSDEEIKELFKKEEEAYQNSMKSLGNIDVLEDKVVIDSISKRSILSRKARLFENVDYYGGYEKEVCQGNYRNKDLIIYFDSLNQGRKISFLSYISSVKCDYLNNNIEFQNFIQQKLIDFLDATNNDKEVQESFTKFKINTSQEEYLRYAVNFLDAIEAGDYKIDVQDVLYFLFKKGHRKLSFDYYCQFIEMSINRLRNKDIDRPYPLLEYSFYYEENFIENEFLLDASYRKQFIDTCLYLLESNSFKIYEINELINLLWERAYFTQDQYSRFINYVQYGIKNHYQYKDRLNRIGYNYNTILINHYGMDYLRNYLDIGHYAKDKFPFHAHRYLLYNYDFNEHEKEEYLAALKRNLHKLDTAQAATTRESMFYRLSDFDHEGSNYNFEIPELISTLKVLNVYDSTNFKSCKRVLSNRNMKHLSNENIFWKAVGDSVSYIKFAAEVGMVPVDYIEMIGYFSHEIKQKYNFDIHAYQVNKNFDQENYNTDNLFYELFLWSEDHKKMYEVTLENTSDWYAPKAVVSAINFILEDHGIDKKWMLIEDSSGAYKYMLIEPGAFKLIQEKISLYQEYGSY